MVLVNITLQYLKYLLTSINIHNNISSFYRWGQYLFSISFHYTLLRNVILSFMESWANPVVVAVAEVVVVQVAVVAVHIPHVVSVVRRPKPIIQNHVTRNRDLHSIALFFWCALRHILKKFWCSCPKFMGRCYFFQKLAPSLKLLSVAF